GSRPARGRGRFPAALGRGRGGAAPASGATQSAVEPAGTLAWADVVCGASRDPDGQQRRGADVARAGGRSQELCGVASIVEWPVAGADAVAAGDPEVVEFEPPALVDGVPASVCAGWGARARRALPLVALESNGRTTAGVDQPANATGFDVAWWSPQTKRSPTADDETQGTLPRSVPVRETALM